MVFDTEADAERARQALLDNGFSEDDVLHYRNCEATAEFEKSEGYSVDPLQIGQEVAMVDQYLTLAKEGCDFLVLHAPEDEAAKSAVEVVRSMGLKFAENTIA